MSRILVCLTLILLTACASRKTGLSSDNKPGDTRTLPVVLLDDNTYLLTDSADDPTYAFSKTNPVKVGGVKDRSGPKNERRYLNALLGPNGEPVKYFRSGSCCAFKTPNGIFDESGLLDVYKIHWTGAKDTLDVYLNMYDEGNLKIPVGLTSRKKT